MIDTIIILLALAFLVGPSATLLVSLWLRRERNIERRMIEGDGR